MWLDSFRTMLGLQPRTRKSRKSQKKRPTPQRHGAKLLLETLEDRIALSATVVTDQFDYRPEETAIITASGFDPGTKVKFQVVHDSLTPGLPGGKGHQPWKVRDGGRKDLDGLKNGTVVTSWYVNPDDSLGATFDLTAKGKVDGVKTTAFWTFTDAGSNPDFVAAEPTSYNHATGGGAYDDRTINTDVTESLEGGDFACGDIVTFFVMIDVDNADLVGTLEFDFVFTPTTGQPGVAFTDIVSVSINNGVIAGGVGEGPGGTDAGNVHDGGSVATLISETIPADTFEDDLLGTVEVTDLELGEQVILRVDVRIDCLEDSNPTGNLQASLDGVRDNNGDNIGAGAQTIPFKSPEDLADPDYTVTKEGDTLGKIGDPVTYTITIVNTGELDLFPASIIDSLAGALPAGSFVESGTNNNILQIGETWTFTYNRTVLSGDLDPLTNTVTTIFNTTADFTGFEVTRSDDHTTNLFQPAINIEKSADVTSAVVGQEVTYTYEVTNTGSADSPGLDIVSLIDNNGTATNLDNFTPTPVLSGGDNVGDEDEDGLVDVGETWLFTATRTVLSTDTDPLVNVVEIHANPDGFPNDITDTDTFSIDILAADLTVTKEGDPTSKVGDPVTYTVTITNDGEADLFPQTILDTLQGPLSASDFEESLTDDNVLEVGETWTFEYTRVVQQGDPDPLINTVSVTFNTLSDFTGAIVTGSDGHSTNLFVPDITVEKSADVTEAVVGQEVTYTYEVTNTGSADSPGLDIVSLIDDNGTATGADDFTPTPVESGGFNVGDEDEDGLVDLGETWQFTATRTVTAADTDPLVNEVEIHANPDGFPNDITDTDTFSIDILEPDFTITKDGDALGKIGDDVTYTITIFNNGEADLFAQSIEDSLRGTLAASSFVESLTNDNILEVGETWTLTYSRTVLGSDPDSLTNTVEATFSTQSDDTGAEVTRDDDHTTNLFQPDINVEKSADVTSAVVGQEVTYTYEVTNTGSADSPGLDIVSLIDNNGTASNLDNFTPTPVLDGAFNVGDDDEDGLVDVGETWEFTATRTVTADDTDPLVNVVEIHANPDGFPNDITDTDTFSIDILTPDLTVSKVGDTLGKVGDPVTYTVTITNNGEADLFPQSIIDTLQGALAASSFVESLTNDNVLEVGETWTLEYTRVVQQGDPDPLINTVTVTFNTLADFTGAIVTASDGHSTNLFVPAINVEKSADVSSAVVGQEVTYTYLVTNTGSADSPGLDIVSLIDDNGTAIGSDDFTPTPVESGGFNVGDEDEDGLVDLGETWQFTATRTVRLIDSDPLVNEVEIHANPDGFPNDITDTDTFSIDILAPSISLNLLADELGKVTDPVTYTLTITNDGEAPLFPQATVDSRVGSLLGLAIVESLTDDNILEVGETWTVVYTRVVQAGDPDQLTATVDATFNTSLNQQVGAQASATVSATTNLFTPGIDIDKIGPATATVGDKIQYFYTVTNIGSPDSPALENVELFDDNGTPGNLADDKSTEDGTIQFVGGDDGDGLLEQGEIWTFKSTHTAKATDPNPLVSTVLVESNPVGFTNNITDSDVVSVLLTAISIEEEFSKRLFIL